MNGMSERLRGRVKSYNPLRRWGFIAVNLPGPDAVVKYHFHVESFRDRRSEGESYRGVILEFTPMKVLDAGKCDKATDIVVVG